MRKLICLLLLLIGAEPAVESKDLPRTVPVEPADALKTFSVRPGFHIELVASEPLVMDPVAMAFDESGRLFVVEMRDYSERRDERLGRIKLLVDEDGDGTFDKATVYADDLPWPTAVICWDGGIFVGTTPDIIYFKDTDNNGVADEKKVVFTGFGGLNGNRLNVQQLLNSFNWGLDNRIHGANGGSTGSVTSPEHQHFNPIDIRGRDFSFDPRTLDLRAESGGGQHGLSFDATGRKFVCSNSHHLQVIMYDIRYASRNPHYAMPAALVDIAADGPAAEVYRTSPEEPWRVIRTKWRVSGLVSGPIEGGGRSAGYFTGATGVTIYRGHAWGEEFVGDAFTGDAGGNLVHRKKVRPDGVKLVATRPDDEQKREFLASGDNWFRPVQFANAPDGNLYIADMYRETIEHPWSLPESIKKHLDLNSGNDRGRIYRVLKDGFKQPPLPRLGEMTTLELVEVLEHPNGWHRETAARLIYQRQDKAAIEPLVALLERSASAYACLHALYALDGLGALEATSVGRALEANSPLVRRHAVRLAEKFARKPQAASTLTPKLVPLIDDPDALVRYQLAFTLGEFNHTDRPEMLARLIRRNAKDRWICSAAFSSLANGSADVFARLFGDNAFASSNEGREVLQQLAVLVGAQDRQAEITQLCAKLTAADDRHIAFALARGLGEGLARNGKSLQSIAQLKPLVGSAAKVAPDAAANEQLRLQAIGLLGLAADIYTEHVLYKVLHDENAALKSAALAALDRLNPKGLAAGLIGSWRQFTPKEQADVLAILLKRPERAKLLLNAIRDGKLKRAVLSSTQVRFLHTHPDPTIRGPAKELVADPAGGPRQAVIEAFTPALELRGNAERGKTIFKERCSSCHRMGDEGFALGPDLVTVKNSGKEKLLVNILDPNREVATQYSAYQVDTKDGENLLGIISTEAATSITVRQAYGIETVVFRSNIKRLKNQGESIMPQGLEEGLKPQDLADLLEFISK